MNTYIYGKKPRDYWWLALFTIALLYVFFLSGCSSIEVIKENPQPNRQMTLAWGESKRSWTEHLYKVLPVLGPNLIKAKPADYKEWCGTLKPVDCYAQLISIMAKYESNFKPETSYAEGGHLKGITSRGLLQISIASANSYGCNFKKEADLHDPFENLNCGILILNNWIPKDGVIAGGTKLGMGRYWSVGRSSSKSNSKIKVYMQSINKGE